MTFSLRKLSPAERQIVFAYGAAVVLFAIGMVVSSTFAGAHSTTALSTQASFIGIAAIGQTFAMLSGGVDLSVPWVMTSAAIVVTQITGGSNEALIWAVPLTLMFGATVGAINGAGISILNVPPIVMTLAMNVALQGAALLITKGSPGAKVPTALNEFCIATVGPVRVVFILWLVLAALVTFYLSRTVFGRRLYAIGSNEQTARFSGIRTSRARVVAYMVSGTSAALAGMLVAGYNQLVFINLGDPYLFSTIAAVAVGGIAMVGGSGSYIGTMAGALVLAILSALLLVLNISSAALAILFGLVILLTVAVGSKRVDPFNA